MIIDICARLVNYHRWLDIPRVLKLLEHELLEGNDKSEEARRDVFFVIGTSPFVEIVG